MKRYFNHMEQKTPHERRQHAMRVAGVVTTLVFVGWIGTLGMRLNSLTVAKEGEAPKTQLANIISSVEVRQTNTLEVATTTQY